VPAVSRWCSQPDFRTEGNFTLFIDKAAAAKFKTAGISDPAEHFDGKKVRATGTVKLYRDRPEIAIEEPKQVELVENK
jgi:DNA/RNA endonuclease YhcR with UshA esterase domain